MHDKLTPYKPGQSGNPAGRQKGSRNKLGEAFIEALHVDFLEHGVATIVRVREERPQDYLKVISSVLPRQFEVKADAFDGMSDEELASFIAFARAAYESVQDERDDVEKVADEKTRLN